MASIFYKGFMLPCYLDDSHTRQGELLLALPAQVFLSPEELSEALKEDLNSCVRPDDLPWEEIEKEVEGFAQRAFHDIALIVERWQAEGNDLEDEDCEEVPYLYFVVEYE